MSLNAAPLADRIHIGIFGKRNVGKSSLINAITGQNLAIVSDIKGTTTDPVLKSMELLPLGPVVIIDTPGLDDSGELGTLRIQKAYQILNKTDIAVLVVDGSIGTTHEDTQILERIRSKNIPYIIAMNKADLISAKIQDTQNSGNTIWVSAAKNYHIHELKEMLARQVPQNGHHRHIAGDLLSPSDFAILVVPIDKSAPKGRLILPQQQTIRDILDADAAAIVIKENELANTLAALGPKVKLVITDSQIFDRAAAATPANIMLTSFSILFARYKGDLQAAVSGARALDTLSDGNTLLISEGCTHHRQCDDIGTIKLPRWIQEYTGKKLNFEFTSGGEFPFSLPRYSLIVHCGGCTLNEREMKYRIKCAEDSKIPITNYGIAIAHMNGILERSIAPFPNI